LARVHCMDAVWVFKYLPKLFKETNFSCTVSVQLSDFWF
jgi:hypothetical protein